MRPANAAAAARLVLLALLLVLAAPAAVAQAGARAYVVAGSGQWDMSGDGHRATDAGGWFFDVAGQPDGGFLTISSDHGVNGVVRRVDAHGVITTVAGTTSLDPLAPLGDGGPATRASLQAGGVAVLPDGAFLVLDVAHNRVRRVDTRGIITTVAGSGEPIAAPPVVGASAPGDGGPATGAALAAPAAVAALPDGGFLIAESAANRIRRVAPDGIITTVAGTGELGDSGDGGPARSAMLYAPKALAARTDGSFLLVEGANLSADSAAGRRVRLVDRSGRITTVAGGGRTGNCYNNAGDGRAATSVALTDPRGVAAIPLGGFVIADGTRVRKINARGVITTIAGAPTCTQVTPRTTFFDYASRALWSGLADRLGESGRSAWIDAWGVAVRPEGSILVAGSTHVLTIATGRRPPLAIALRRPSMHGGAISLSLATSRPGRTHIEVRRPHGRGVAAAETRRLPAGASTIALRRLPRGPYVVHATLAGEGRVASDNTVIFSGSRLPATLARAAIATRCCEKAAPFERRALAAGPAQESATPRDEVRSCRRFGATRVDCLYGPTARVCSGVITATLRNALVYLAPYACHGASRFRMDPARAPARVATLLSR